MKKLCIIPARANSKRIPNKNIRRFLGKPIIAYSIETAINFSLFDEVMVSTDSVKIAKIAQNYKANVPFLRSKKNSNDKAGLFSVFEEVIAKYREKGQKFDYICIILATAPFINTEMLRKGFKTLIKESLTSVVPIVEFDYPIFRALKIKNNKLKMICPENLNKRSQDLQTAFHDAGLFYWIDSKKIKNAKSFFTKNTGFIKLDKAFIQDIDTLEDWKIAEVKYKILNGVKNYA